MSDFRKMWDDLKFDMELAVEEGFERGFNSQPETEDGGRFIAFRYVLDMMNEMEGEKNED